MGGGGTGGGSGGAPSCATFSSACAQCHNSACSAEHDDCSSDTDCKNAHEVAGPCLCSAQNASDDTAVQQRIATEQAAGATAKALIDCIVQQCGTECDL